MRLFRLVLLDAALVAVIVAAAFALGLMSSVVIPSCSTGCGTVFALMLTWTAVLALQPAIWMSNVSPTLRRRAWALATAAGVSSYYLLIFVSGVLVTRGAIGAEAYMGSLFWIELICQLLSPVVAWWLIRRWRSSIAKHLDAPPETQLAT